jgi:hypothetical protein
MSARDRVYVDVSGDPICQQARHHPKILPFSEAMRANIVVERCALTSAEKTFTQCRRRPGVIIRKSSPFVKP